MIYSDSHVYSEFGDCSSTPNLKGIAVGNGGFSTEMVYHFTKDSNPIGLATKVVDSASDCMI